MSGVGSGVFSGRRRIAVVFLVAGAAALAATAAKDYPREQPIVFRLPDTRRVTLIASFTKVGEAEARTGFTLALPDRRMRDVSHTIRVPNGDYIVTLELRRAKEPSEPSEPDAQKDKVESSEETSVSRRVSLTGIEVVVPVPARSE